MGDVGGWWLEGGGEISGAFLRYERGSSVVV